MLGRFCLFTRYIPRGKGKAPKIVMPTDDIKEEQLRDQLSLARKNIDDISSINGNATFKHPYFGVLNKKQTIKFVEVHTKHHLKIMRDILK